MAPVSYERKILWPFTTCWGGGRRLAGGWKSIGVILALKAAVTGWSLLSNMEVQDRGFRRYIQFPRML